MFSCWLARTVRPGPAVRRLSVDVEARRLGYSEYGDPCSTVSLLQEQITCSLQPRQVLAKYLLCPVNPADINVLQGTYPIRPPLPATGGGRGGRTDHLSW